MTSNKNSSNKLLIGVMPMFSSLGETLTFIEIAKEYIRLGGGAVFFSSDIASSNLEIYENLAENIGCKVVRIRSKISEKAFNKAQKLGHKFHHENFPAEKIYSTLFDKRWESFTINNINKEFEVFKKEKVKLLVSSFIFSCHISTYLAKIPLAYVTSGTALPPYFEYNHATFPMYMENFFTRFIPQSIKNRLTNLYALRCKWNIKGYNRLARKYNTPKKKRFLDLLSGDYTLIPDDINFLNLESTPSFPSKNYVGPILPDFSFGKKEDSIDFEIENYLTKHGRSILLTFGSQGAKNSFITILKTLNKTDYNVIAIYTTVLREAEIPNLKNNIMLKNFVPSIKKINEIVDLAIIHGGLGTVHTAAYSGKPVIGIPMQPEQQYNLDNLVRHGSAKMLDKTRLSEKNILNAVNEIFNNYDKYLKNAQLLKRKMPPSIGAQNAAKRLLEIVQQVNLSK